VFVRELRSCGTLPVCGGLVRYRLMNEKYSGNTDELTLPHCRILTVLLKVTAIHIV